MSHIIGLLAGIFLIYATFICFMTCSQIQDAMEKGNAPGFLFSCGELLVILAGMYCCFLGMGTL